MPIRPHKKDAASAAAPTIRWAVNFFEKINGTGVPEMGLAACREGHPLPSISGIIQLGGRLQIKSWRSITCGQNLDLKGLTHRARGINSHNATDALSAHRHGLDDDRKIAGLRARLDVTCACGKEKLRGQPVGEIVSVEVHGGKTPSKRGTAPLKPKAGLNGPPDGSSS